MWCPPAAAALAQLRGFALWTCHVPDELIKLAQMDALPCGVVEICGIV